MVLDAFPFVFDCPRSALSPAGSGVLKMTANRYTTFKSAAANTQGLTFVFLHGIGAHKEQWEPLISELFSLQQNKPPHLQVREAWSLDRQNHGNAAVLNADELAVRDRGQFQAVSAAEWGEGIAAFLNSEHMRGNRIVVVGHSAGSAAGVIATKHLDLSVVCIEAHRWLKSRFPWNRWDERVLRLLVSHGLTLTPCNINVTLKCPKHQESVSFPDTFSQFSAIEQFQKICRLIPLHVVWGTKDHLLPEIVQGSISDESQGRVAGSVTKMVGCGHMMFQERPGEGVHLFIVELHSFLEVMTIASVLR
ncbi:CN hydrolase domain-containing protein [Favolaschia claudopus]|uniref:CN hydrolase domain-containing protein n=1 Tax=Favolaschia claudopus TaxID=2862362 RepID=A0AAV9ZFM8_9AGAR